MVWEVLGPNGEPEFQHGGGKGDEDSLQLRSYWQLMAAGGGRAIGSSLRAC